MSTASSRNSDDGASPRKVVPVDLAGVAWVRTPSQGTPIVGTGLQTTAVAATLQSQLAGASGLTTYLSGFQVTGMNASAAAAATIFVTGGVGTTQFYTYGVGAGALGTNPPLIVSFVPAYAASVASGPITVTLASIPSGNTTTLAAQGFQQ